MLRHFCGRLQPAIPTSLFIRMFYAVKTGFSPGIYNTWEECAPQVLGFKGAKYKKFDTEEAALQFINLKRPASPPASGATASDHAGATSTASACKKIKIETDASKPAGEWRVSKLCTTFFGSKVPSEFPDRAVVYTDGSCLSNGYPNAVAGVGVYWAPQHPRNLSVILAGKQTNQRAEIQAVVAALTTAIDMGLSAIEVRTDSKYVVNSMSIWADSWLEKGWDKVKVTNKEDLKELALLCRQIDVNLVHVPAHQNVYGNNEADRLARAASHLAQASG